jgi:L-lactate utilization protein LutC
LAGLLDIVKKHMPYDILASEETINKTAAALTAKKYNVVVVANRAEALAKLKTMIPAGSDVMTGGSVTLDEIGFTDLLRSNANGWVNWKDKIMAEKDQAKQMDLRKQSSMAAYYLASAHALSEDGTILQGSASGSQIPAFDMLSSHAIFIIGCQKIVPNMAAAIKRVQEYCLPMEDKRQKSLGNPGSFLNKILITFGDMFSGRITVILVKEKLGF